MSNLQRSKHEVLINNLSGNDFRIAYNAETGKLYFQDRVRGLTFEGRDYNATYVETVDTDKKAFKTTVPPIATKAPLVMSYAYGATSPGTARVIDLTPVTASYDSGKLTSVYIINVPRISGESNLYDKYAFTRSYTVDTDTLSLATGPNLINAFVSLINADTESIVTASNASGKLRLTAKNPKLMFIANTSYTGKNIGDIPSMAFTAEYSVKGSYPKLDYEWLRQQFAVLPGDEGSLKEYPVNADYAMISFVAKTENHPGVTTANELVGQHIGVTYYIKKDQLSLKVFNHKLYDKTGSQVTNVSANCHTGDAVESGGLTFLNVLNYTLLPGITIS